MLLIGFPYTALIMFMYVPYIPDLKLLTWRGGEFCWRPFHHIMRWSCEYFLSICWYSGLCGLVFQILSHPHIPGMKPTWSSWMIVLMYFWMGSKSHLNKCSKFLFIWDCKSKQPCDSTLNQTECLRTRAHVTAHAGENVEPEEHSLIAGGIAGWYNHYGKQSGYSSENWK